MHSLGFEAYGFSGLGEAPEDRFTWIGSATLSMDWAIVLYAATHEYMSRVQDTPTNQIFLGTLEKAFRVDRSILGADIIGESITIGLGEVQLTNSESDYDTLTTEFSPVGQLVKIRMGDRIRPYSEWQTILQGYLTDMQLDRSTIRFSMRDSGFKLDVPTSPNTYAGTGSVEGTSDLQDKRKPRFFGYVYNVRPPLVIPSALTFQLNDGQIQSVSAVYVRGVALTFGGDFANVTLLNAAALTIGFYGTCLAQGFMRVAVADNTELGDITCDFAGDAIGGVFVSTTSDIVRRLLATSGTGVFDPADLVTATFSALNSEQGAPIGYGVEAGSDETVATSVGNIMAGIGGWCGARRSGNFEVTRFDAPSAFDALAGTYDKRTIADVRIIPLPSDITPPPWRVVLAYQKNWTVQTNLAGSVTDDRRAFLAQEFRTVAVDNVQTRIDFPPGKELVKNANSNFRDIGDALTEAQRLLDLYGQPRALYVIKLCEPLFIHELGQTIEVDFPRFDLEGGKRLRIVKLTEDDIEGVEITAFG